MISIQKSPATRQIQPIGFRGCLEAIKAPTTGKARKGTETNRSPKPKPSPQLLGTFADLTRTDSATLATNMATERPASDQASHAAVRALIPPIPPPSSLAPSVTTPPYSTTVSQALRQPLRE